MLAIVAIAISALATGPLVAQTREFTPSIILSQVYTSNIQYLDEDAEVSDSVTTVIVKLPWEWRTKNSVVNLAYTPSVLRYADADSLDRTEHRVNLGFSRNLDRGSSTTVTTGYTKSQLQGDAQSAEDPDLFISRRTDRTIGRASLTYSRRMSPRWRWRATAGGSASRFEEISGFDAGGGDPVEDRMEYRGGFGISRALSRKTHVGGEYGYQVHDLDVTGEETVHTVSATLNHTVSRKLSVEGQIGAFLANGDAARSSPADPDDERSGARATFSLSRALRKVSVSATATHVPSAGGSRSGTSTNSVVGLSVTNNQRRNWSWRGSVRAARRDPTDSAAATLDSLSVGGQVEKRLGRGFAVSANANYIDQNSSNDPDDAAFVSAAVGLVWYPKGWK